MKKLYSLATLLFLAMLGMVASAASYTFVVNDPSLVKSIKSYSPETEYDFNGESSLTIDIGGGFNISLECVSGYAITSVKSMSASGSEGTAVSSATTSCSLSVGSWGEYSDGTTFTVTIEKLEATTFTLEVDDYTHLESISGVESFDSNEIEVSFTVLDYAISLTGATASTGKYMIKSVEYANGDTVEPGILSFGIETSKISQGDVVKVTTELKELPYYTFVVTDIAHIKDVKGQAPSAYNPVDNTFNLVTEDNYFSITPADGYQINSIKCGDDDLYLSYGSFPLKSNTTVYFQKSNRDALESGSTITVVTEEKTYPVWTFHGAKGVQFKYNDYVVVSDEEDFEYQLKGDSGNLYISCTEDGKRVKSVTKAGSSYGETVTDGVAQIYIYNPTAAEYNIETVEYFTGTFKVTADDPSKVNLYVGSSYYPVELTEGENEIEFASDNSTVKIRHSSYSEKIYSVKVNGVAIARDATDYYGSFVFEPADGDVVEITADFPVVEVPVSFSFGDEDVTKIVTSVRYGYSDEIDNWADEDFTVQLGKTLNIYFNTGAYENITLTANGEPVTVSYGSASYTVDSEDPIEFVITADKAPVNTMTINCEQWEHLKVYTTYTGYSYSGEVELTGPTSAIELTKNNYNVYFQAQDNFYFAEGTGITTPVVTYSTQNEDGKELTFVLEQLVRETPVVIYAESEEVAKATTFNLENSNFRGSFTASYNGWSDNLFEGYNTIFVGENDIITFYPYSKIYVNGELHEEYTTLDPIPANTVIKMFSEEPEMFDVTFNVAEGVQLNAFKDIITKLDLTEETHSVEKGTAVSFTFAEGAPKATVTVNGEALEAVDGAYTFTVDAETTVEVAVVEPYTFTLTVAEPEAVTVTVGEAEVELTAGANTFKFYEEAAEVTVTGVKENATFEVTVNEKAVEGKDNVFTFEAADGDKVVVTVTDVPVVVEPSTFTLTVAEPEAVTVTVGEAEVELTAGANTIEFDEEAAEVTVTGVKENATFAVTVNEKAVEGKDNVFTFEAADGDKVVVTVTDVPVVVEPEKVVTTVVSEDWANIEIFTDEDLTEAVAVEGKSTAVEVEKDAKFYICAKAPYYISTITDSADGDYDLPATSVEVTAAEAATITVVLAQIERNSDLTVFVQDKAVEAAKFTLADADMPELSATPAAKAGYNTFKFAENDVLTVAGADLLVYVNDAKVNAAEEIDNLTPTTVVKVFAEAPQSWTMNYKFGEGVEVEVYHDHVTKVASPATHSVFHGTHVAIKPVAASTEAASAPAAKLDVKVNGTALQPNADGVYEFTAEQDVEIAVAKVSSGLEAILVDGQDADIYNLQGVKVGNTADTKTLTPGIYIINGVKIRL